MASNDKASQTCPKCGATIDTTDADPLVRIDCPKCGEKVRVERAFDNFVVEETLGIGGMGTVYKARDTLLDRLVALKLLRKDLGEEIDYRTRLRQEARVAASVNHPNVIQVFSSGTDHGQFYLVMELVDHGSLDDLIEQRKRLPEEQVLEAGIQVAKGLRAAHAKGLIHRDVKPANILFADENTAKIGDFGLAGVAAETSETRGEIWGTPYYVAPERLDNQPEDFRSDIYSLGATLFHAVAGRAPIEGETNSATALRELKNKPVDLRSLVPEVSAATARVLHRMIEADPARRFSSYDELVAELQKAERERKGEGGGEGGSRKGQSVLLLGVAALILAAAVAGYFSFKGKSKTEVAPGTVVTPSAQTVSTGELERQFDDARRQLLAGHHKVAHAAFARAALDAKGRQPLHDWLLLNQGLAAMVGREKSQSRQAFQDAENAGQSGFSKQDSDLGKFLLATAKMMTAAGGISSSAVPKENAPGFEAFSFLLFALKDLDQSNANEAIPLLERFGAAQPTGKFAWINDYKPLAQKYLDDARLYADWKKDVKASATTAELSASLEKLLAARKKFKTRTGVSDDLAAEERALTKRVEDQQRSEAAAHDQDRKKTLNQEAPLWNAAVAAYKQKVPVYDFTGARDVIAAAKVSEPSLREAQAGMQKKAQWLLDWKTKLIEDINRSQFSGMIADVTNAAYNGVASANANQLTLRSQYGVVPLAWTRLSPQTLLTISSSFIKANAPDVADREWLSAVFAAETGQHDAARDLAEKAAGAKPEYRSQIGLIIPPAATKR